MKFYYLHSPFLFDEMDLVIERILSAKNEKWKKLEIFGDRDVDGITSTVLLKNRIR